MWETEFSSELLGAKEGVVIHCPEEPLACELLEFLHKMELHGPVEPRVQGGANTKAIRPIMFGTDAFCTGQETMPKQVATKIISNARFTALSPRILT